MRQILVKVVMLFAVVGVGFALYPFVASMQPSAKARANRVFIEVDLQEIEEGKAIRYQLKGMPIVILHRTEEQIRLVKELITDRELSPPRVPVPDPQGMDKLYRSFHPEYFIAYGWTGNSRQCSSFYSMAPIFSRLTSIPGGFEEQCRGAWHDVTGRLLKGSWSESGDLPIPPHEYISTNVVKIGPIVSNQLVE